MDVILKLAKPLHILDDDLVAAAELRYGDAKNKVASFLDIAKGMVVSEAVICHFLKHSSVNDQIIKLLMQRNGDIGVTAKMLEAVQNHYDLEKLLKHKPVCPITPEILKSKKTLKCMKLLPDIDPETPVTEEIIFRALEVGAESRVWSFEKEWNDLLETLFDRSSGIAVTQEMLQAVGCAADMEILLKRLEPGTRISTDVLAAVTKIELGEANYRKLNMLGEACRTMRLLLKFDPSIRPDPKMALQMIKNSNAIDALEMFLEHDPSMPITEKIFLEIFGQKDFREELADLMHKYGIRLVFTDKIREVIDHAYQRTSETANKKRFYSLRVIDEDDIEPEGKSTNGKTPETSFERSESDSDDADEIIDIELGRATVTRSIF